jgi:hypothetical protein
MIALPDSVIRGGALSGFTNIPRAAGGAQVGETILILGFSSQPWNRFVHLDPPGLIRPWEMTEFEQRLGLEVLTLARTVVS